MNNCDYDETIQLALKKFLELSMEESWISDWDSGYHILYHSKSGFVVKRNRFENIIEWVLTLNGIEIYKISSTVNKLEYYKLNNIYIKAIYTIHDTIQNSIRQDQCQLLKQVLDNLDKPPTPPTPPPVRIINEFSPLRKFLNWLKK